MHIALYQPDIPQNLGAILRTSACFGFDVEIIEPCGFPLDDKKIRRAGMDYIEKVSYTKHASWQKFCDWFEDHKLKIEKQNLPSPRLILLSSKAENSYTDFKFNKHDVLLMGRESAGVTDEVSNYCKDKITIPMQPGTRSLNVAISAAIVMGEVVRQVK